MGWEALPPCSHSDPAQLVFFSRMHRSCPRSTSGPLPPRFPLQHLLLYRCKGVGDLPEKPGCSRFPLGGV